VYAEHHNGTEAGRQTGPNNIARRRAVMDRLPHHLRMLARYAERLGLARDPERFAASKGEIVKTLEALAVLIELDSEGRRP
jgi:hypothetical protein